LSHGRFSPYEFALVIGIAFGWSIIGSVWSLYTGHTVGEAGTRDSFNASHLYAVVVSELIYAPIVATILYVRGWRFEDFPLGIGKVSTFLGVAIFIGAWCLDAAFTAALRELFDSMKSAVEIINAYKPSKPPDLVAIYILSVINPVFEEVIVCGYVIPALSSRFGTTTAVNVSATIRGTYHLYQGIVAAPLHFSYGLIQAYVFVRFGKLWPLIVSHALLDFVALLFLI
jgi:membrane protease YdiL (CAAX protease family)